MKIRYHLLGNPMTSDPNDCRVQITDYKVITAKELPEYITRQRSSITVSEAKANYEEIIGAHEYFLRQGFGINTEFLNIRPVAQGIFRDDDEKFDSSRHKLKYKTNLGRRPTGVGTTSPAVREPHCKYEG
jgi:hypothetical protein